MKKHKILQGSFNRSTREKSQVFNVPNSCRTLQGTLMQI